MAVLSEPLQLTLLLEISLQGVPHRWMCEGWLRLAAPIQLHSWECFRSLFGFLVHEDSGCHSRGGAAVAAKPGRLEVPVRVAASLLGVPLKCELPPLSCSAFIALSKGREREVQ